MLWKIVKVEIRKPCCAQPWKIGIKIYIAQLQSQIENISNLRIESFFDEKEYNFSIATIIKPTFLFVSKLTGISIHLDSADFLIKLLRVLIKFGLLQLFYLQSESGLGGNKTKCVSSET